MVVQKFPGAVACALLLIGLTSQFPTAAAACETVDGGPAAGQVNLAAGERCDWEDGCSGINLIVAAGGSCDEDEGPGCHGVNVILASPGSCVGAPGAPGCKGVTVVDPFSSGSCASRDVDGWVRDAYDLEDLEFH